MVKTPDIKPNGSFIRTRYIATIHPLGGDLTLAQRAGMALLGGPSDAGSPCGGPGQSAGAGG